MTREGEASAEGTTAAARAERRRRLARVFGDVLPDQTGDDRADEAEESTEQADAWLRSQVPPHHG